MAEDTIAPPNFVSIDGLHPLHNVVALREFAILSLHTGKATLGRFDGHDHAFAEFYRRMVPNAPTLSQVEFDAAFLMPAAGECLFFLQSPANFRLARNYGRDLRITGQSSDGPFTLTCDELYVEAEGDGAADRRWAIAKSMNAPAELAYGEDRPAVRVTGLINNFDFDAGNELGNAGRRDILRVSANGRQVDFVRRNAHKELKALLEAGAIGPAPLVEFSFETWPGASDSNLIEFAGQVAGLIGLAAQQHTGLPLITFLDTNGKPAKRFLADPLRSNFRREYILNRLAHADSLPRLFEECFDSYGKMVKSALWGTLPSFCKTILDPMYMEHKCANVMAGVERLMRNALVENKALSPEVADKKTLPELIGSVRTHLTWDVPQFYTAKDRPRLLRNAVAHGGPLPWPSEEVAKDVQLWRLFLMRRVLIQLGYSGKVRSPSIKSGYWSESVVDDFSEENNSFG